MAASWSASSSSRDAPALVPAKNVDEQQEQEGAVGSSQGLQLSAPGSSQGVQLGASDTEGCSSSDLAVRQWRPYFLRTQLSPGFLQTMHRSLLATLRLLQLERLATMLTLRKAVLRRASKMTSIGR